MSLSNLFLYHSNFFLNIIIDFDFISQESGIVFIDEIDKLVSNSDYKSADASSEGVQRDLLPLIEGTLCDLLFVSTNIFFIYCSYFTLHLLYSHLYSDIMESYSILNFNILRFVFFYAILYSCHGTGAFYWYQYM